jgi:hypothetical protein
MQEDFMGQFFSEIVRNFKLPNESKPLLSENPEVEDCLMNYPQYQNTLDQILKQKTIYGSWSDMNVALSAFTSQDAQRKALAIKWLCRELTKQEKKTLGVTEYRAADAPSAVAELVYYLKNLALDFKTNGFLLMVDETERVGFMRKNYAIKAMIALRDFVNKVNSDARFSKNVHLIYAVSDEWLSTGRRYLVKDKTPRVMSLEFKIPISAETSFFQVIENAPKIGTDTEPDEIKEIISKACACYIVAHPQLKIEVGIEDLYKTATKDETVFLPREVLNLTFEQISRLS